jgi:hypothetical protein
MSMNKTWAISSWISFLISVGILSGALRLDEFHNCASFRVLSVSAMFSSTSRVLCAPPQLQNLDGECSEICRSCVEEFVQE